ncbi:MAG: hypothetical protein QM640_05605 [Niabella sp.]
MYDKHYIYRKIIMLYKLLLPNKYKKAGWFILVPATILGIILMLTDFEGMPLNAKVFAVFNNEILGKSQSFRFIYANVTNTVEGVLFIIGALLVGFSKEKNEDEFISNLRLSSLLWAVLVNYVLLIFSFLFIYGTAFLNVMLYNMFTVLIIFIVRFNYVLYRNSKSMSNEEYY